MTLWLYFLTWSVGWATPLDEESEDPIPLSELTEEGLPIRLVNIADASSELPLWQRMRDVSEELKGLPYVFDPIGEGRGEDPDPPARYDVFDCLSFVEEVLALTMPENPRDAAEIRNMLRYGPSGEISYTNRNHFMMHQWIPHNIGNGLLVDIGGDLGEAFSMVKTVRTSTWTGWRHRNNFQLTDEQLPTGDFELSVLPLEEALEAVANIPPGSLILTVRDNHAHLPIVVTHIGFVVPSADPARPLLRHATRMGSEPRVRDDFLDWYFQHLQGYRNWQVAGIVVLEPRER